MCSIKKMWKQAPFRTAVVAGLIATVLGSLIAGFISWCTHVTLGLPIEKWLASSSPTETSIVAEPPVSDPNNTETPKSGVTSSANTESGSTTTSSPSAPSPKPTEINNDSADRLAARTPSNPPENWDINKTFQIGSTNYDHSIYARCGLGCQRGTTLEFDLGKQYKTLTATIGIRQDADSADRQVVKLTISLDGNNRGESYILRYGDTQTISVSVENVSRIRFEVNYAGDDQKRDADLTLKVVIGEPLLYRE